MTEEGNTSVGERPAQKIGVVGGGQLARMMLPAAIELGIELHVLAISENESAAQESSRTMLGEHTEAQRIRDFAAVVDALTFDHEHVPQEILRALEKDGHKVRPGAQALQYAQNKLLMRAKLSELGYPCPQWWKIESEQDLETALAQAGGPVVLKTPVGGYDGHGVMTVTEIADAHDWLSRGAELLAEEKVPFTRELSAQVARSANGELASFPIVESEQKDGICYRVTAPAPHLSETKQAHIQKLAADIAADLQVVGMLAVELFEYPNGHIAINELAMRPHNTGHWTMDGAVTGQFEQHLRAVAGLPLGATDSKAPWTVMVNLLGDTEEDLYAGAARAMASHSHLKVHLYGKDVKPGRKVGHVNLSGDDAEAIQASALEAARTIVTKERAL